MAEDGQWSYTLNAIITIAPTKTWQGTVFFKHCEV